MAPPPPTSKIQHFYPSPTSSAPATAFLFPTNQWKWPIQVPFSSLILNGFFCCVSYHIQWHQGLWRVCSRHSQKLWAHHLGLGSFYTEAACCLGLHDVCAFVHCGHCPSDWLTSLPLAAQSRQHGWTWKSPGPSNFPSPNKSEQCSTWKAASP